MAKMEELGMDRTEYEFYLDLRKYNTVPHGGFGIGIERMVTSQQVQNTSVKLFHSHVCCITVSNHKLVKEEGNFKALLFTFILLSISFLV